MNYLGRAISGKIYIKAGSISIDDATLIQAQHNRPNKDKNGNNTQDPEADYNVKIVSNGKRKNTYEFKAHVNDDEDGIVKAMELTKGNIHDPQVFTELLSDDDEKVFAYSSYASKKPND